MTCAECFEYYDCPIRRCKSIRSEICGYMAKILRIGKYANDRATTRAQV